MLLEAERELLARERQLTEALARANRTLDHLARHDNLTGLLNRTALYEHLEREQARAARYDGDFCVVMIDLDHFKRVNDDYGHLVGDHVLQAVASALSGQLRGNDVLGRYGGEEFVAMLPETTLSQAKVLIERLRACVAALRPDTAAGPIPVTISMGLAAYRQGDSLKQLLDRADDALYRAKAAGRNRYEVGV
jgi:diguanylate cyclase (GGDEF)-like protein